MEEDGWAAANKNPKYLIGGMIDGQPFANVGGNSEEEIQKGLQLIARDTGGVVPNLDRADIYVKLVNGVISPRTGFDIIIPDHS